MATKYPDLFAALAAPFPPEEVKQLSKGGRSFRFINARQVMNRLDEVVGPEGWEFAIRPWGNDLIGTLTITLPDGTRVSKSDVGGRAGMSDPENDAKSASSDALKRCGAMLGIARELYGDGTADLTGDGHARHESPARADRGRDDRRGSWGNTSDRGDAGRRPSGGDGERRQYSGPPKTGRALFAWVKAAETEHDISLLKYLNGWSRLQDFPGKMTEWDGHQVALGYAEAIRKLGGESEGGTADDREYAEALSN